MSSTADYKIVEQFSKADSVGEIWSAARQLMANRSLSEFVEGSFFLEGFDRLPEFVNTASNIDRLLALDLLIRLPAASKKLTNQADVHLRKSLSAELPPLDILKNTSHLPDQAKPADIRENIATSLKYATGDWVENYILNSIVREQQSQRTREVLLAEYLSRTDALSECLLKLTIKFKANSGSEEDTKDRSHELSSICRALTNIISLDRRTVEIGLSSIKQLDLLVGVLVKYSGSGPIPPKLEESAVATVRLLDELLTSEVWLFLESDSYIVIERISRWWHLRTYTKDIRYVLNPIISKLVEAILIRAKIGQKSQELVDCLRRAVQDPKQVEQIRNNIAARANLDPNIEDWLRGKERRTVKRSRTLRRALQSAGRSEIDRAIGTLLILTSNLMKSLEAGKLEQATNVAIGISNRVRSMALQHQLRTEGTVGEIVDYAPSAHETIDTEIPLGDKVKLQAPAVVRVREDETRDVVVKALVSELNVNSKQ